MARIEREGGDPREAQGKKPLLGRLLEPEGGPAVRRTTNREGGECLLPEDQCTKTGRPVAEVLWENHPDMRVPACAAFEECGEVPETVPLNFTEDNMTWVASKLSGAAGALGPEAIKLRN